MHPYLVGLSVSLASLIDLYLFMMYVKKLSRICPPFLFAYCWVVVDLQFVDQK